ncbi:MAG: hypothetical protein NTW80_08920 [Deltaproteobacteria bacterium]|nr:hypothetical protein [Deltaproteobacteria bacterium]
MKKLISILMLAILLTGGALAALPAASQAQVYPAPPAQPYANPWVGPSTPWVYYNGDWFLNGVLQYFFGPRYGWAPYYTYPRTYVVRPNNWYAPRWNAWYRSNPVYWNNFHHNYPYWRSHQSGHRYDQRFYEQHHRGQGGGWQRGERGERGGRGER